MVDNAECSDTGTWADTGTWLSRLRREFPRWGIMPPSQAGLWLAVLGKDIALRASSAIELRDKLQAATGLSQSDGGKQRPA